MSILVTAIELSRPELVHTRTPFCCVTYVLGALTATVSQGLRNVLACVYFINASGALTTVVKASGMYHNAPG